MGNYMGLDIGTSGCKAVIFGEDGKQLALAYREYNIISPQPGRAELDPDEVTEKCFEVIAEAASQAKPQSIVGLGISSQGEAFTAVDKDGNALVEVSGLDIEDIFPAVGGITSCLFR